MTALVAHTSVSGLSGGTTGSINTTGATLLVAICVYNGGSSDASVSDSKSNTWTGLTRQKEATAANTTTRIYYAANPTVGSGHTFTVGGGSLAQAMCVMAFSGIKTSSPFDVENGATNTGATSLATGSITPANNGALIIAGLGLGGVTGTPSIDSSFTLGGDYIGFSGGNNYGADDSYLVQGTAAAVNPTWSWTTSQPASAVIAAFKAVLTATASFSSASHTSISVSATALGGSSPYTYQWYRATTANFTPGGGNLLSGATSASLTDSASLAADTVYYYKCIVTDNVSATYTTNQVAGALLASSLSIGCLGDSITKGTAGPSPASVTVTQRLAAQLQSVYQQKSTTVTNQGVDGKGAVDFAADTGSILTNARSAFASASCTHILIMLGANDAAAHRTDTQFSSDMSSICSTLVSDGYKVVLNYPTYLPSGANSGATDEAATENLRTYLAKLDALENGTTILRGDRLAYQYFVDHPTEVQSDQTHMLDAGNISLANMWARALDILLNSSGQLMSQQSL